MPPQSGGMFIDTRATPFFLSALSKMHSILLNAEVERNRARTINMPRLRRARQSTDDINTNRLLFGQSQGVDSIYSASKLGLQFMDAKSRARLIHLLLSKSIVEALLIAAVAVAFYFATTNPGLRGVLDKADKGAVAGWAVDENDPSSHVELQLFIDDKFIAAGRADQYRPDVHASSRAGDDWHGFAFTSPRLSAGEHEARVYAVHTSNGGARRTLQMIGKPFRFITD